MTAAHRDIRDILAEWIRRERLGLIRPFWHDAVQIDDAACEHIRRRADFIIRGLASDGVDLVRTGEPAMRTPTSDVIHRYKLADRNAERLIRYAGGVWEMVHVEDRVETVEQSFSFHQASINAGLVLIDAPEARQIAGLGRQLAALTEIYRAYAHDVGERS
jgi:hypothetical protein